MGHEATSDRSTAVSPLLASRWLRFWARLSDIWIETAVLGFALGYFAPSIVAAEIFVSPSGEKLLSITILPFAMVFDACITSLFGSTPGKVVAGIRVRDIRGNKLPFLRLAKRNGGVWWYGLAAGIPLVSLFTLWASSRRLEANRLTIWDEINETRCFAQSESPTRTVGAAIFALCVIVAVAAYIIHANDPKNLVAAAVRTVQATVPQMLDPDTRLDGAEAGPNGELIYKYTLVSISSDTHDLQVTRDYLSSEAGPAVVKAVCADASLRALLSAGIGMVYRYSDADGTFLDSVRIQPGDCVK